MVCRWIVLTQVFPNLIQVLEPQWIGLDVSFVSSLNSSVTRSLWIAEKIYPVELAPNPFFFNLLNRSSSSFLKIVS